MYKQRIVITGMGQISPLGLTREQLWEGLSSGKSGVEALTQLPPDSPVSFGGEAREFVSDIDNYGVLSKDVKKNIRKGQKVMSRETRLGLAAAQRALHDAGFEGPATDDGSVPVDGSHYSPDRSGIYFGSDYQITMPYDFELAVSKCLKDNHEFDFEQWPEKGLPAMNPLWLLIFLPNMPACHVTMYNDMRGASNSITQREASGNMCLEHASHFLDNGDYDMMLCGATGTRLNPMKALQAFKNEKLADSSYVSQPGQASRPFEKNRSGQVLAEGAGCVVLETLAGAQKRGATVQAELLAGASTVASNGQLKGKPAPADVVRRAVKNVLEVVIPRAGLTPKDIDFVVAHGLSDPEIDKGEAQGIADVFGPNGVNVVAPKANFGNLGAGAGIVELIAGIEALQHGTLFPNPNYTTPDEDCPVRIVTQPVPAGNVFINISISPQGQTSATVIKKFEP